MFGVVCSGRPIELANQVESNKYVATIANASHISFITVFLLPNSNFTDTNYTALIYFQLPNSQEFKLLGGLNPLKPSAIYKINNNSKKNDLEDTDMTIDDSSIAINANDSVSINIGISIETTQQAEILLRQESEKNKLAQNNSNNGNSQALVTTKSTTNLGPNDTAVLANKIVGHAYNFLASFIDDSGKVPIKAFDNWWDKFKAKLSNNPKFLDELQE
ncbi:hypothetical protein DFJ63DRAFT_118963 [Scheffersomyces coipomensis]|uniref:uncharacterized protein n=1 Tax=Scheffersomyces coipomensis TaxID=1788519 RepID=UPI00315CC932